jgi:hypothetical protein
MGIMACFAMMAALLLSYCFIHEKVNMIIYNLQSLKTISDYGIGVPLLSERARRVKDALADHPELGRHIDAWYYSAEMRFFYSSLP